ncbi:hypothetical protein DFP72DRAFT_1066464 [Ephemerocybe angulata]|uniref:Uncharacterized protein n=1 Tax=Ephemerocybe angulata TaxID=980116 RepID=A0A8H6I276_9AGAR|nr:hypothetical protein DFP72DRAFT_1066464 [Tulosesus angulatus]
MAVESSPHYGGYPLLNVAEPQTRGIVRQNTPQRLSLAVAPLMGQRSMLFRVQTDLGGKEDYSQLSANSEASSLQIISASERAPSNPTSSDTTPASTLPNPHSSLSAVAQTPTSSASVWSQESLILAPAQDPPPRQPGSILSRLLGRAPAAVPPSIPPPNPPAPPAKAAVPPPSVPADDPTPAPPSDPPNAQASSETNFPQPRPRARRGRTLSLAPDEEAAAEEHRRYAIAFSPTGALCWEMGGKSPAVNLSTVDLRASRGGGVQRGGTYFAEGDVGGTRKAGRDGEERGAEGEEGDGSTTPTTSTSNAIIRHPHSATMSEDERLLTNSALLALLAESIPPTPASASHNVVAAKMRYKHQHSRSMSLSRASGAGSARGKAKAPPSSFNYKEYVSAVPLSGYLPLSSALPSFEGIAEGASSTLKKAFSRISAYPAAGAALVSALVGEEGAVPPLPASAAAAAAVINAGGVRERGEGGEGWEAEGGGQKADLPSGLRRTRSHRVLSPTMPDSRAVGPSLEELLGGMHFVVPKVEVGVPENEEEKNEGDDSEAKNAETAGVTTTSTPAIPLPPSTLSNRKSTKPPPISNPTPAPKPFRKPSPPPPLPLAPARPYLPRNTTPFPPHLPPLPSGSTPAPHEYEYAVCPPPTPPVGKRKGHRRYASSPALVTHFGRGKGKVGLGNRGKGEVGGMGGTPPMPNLRERLALLEARDAREKGVRVKG